MQLVVSANNDLMNELLFHGVTGGTVIIPVSGASAFPDHPNADGYIDLDFIAAKNIEYPKEKPVFINHVAGTLEGLSKNVIRINGWKSFLKRKVVEAACSEESLQVVSTHIFNCFNRTVTWTPDVPGFTSARIVAMIINEAYFSLQENVSDKNAIDTAMKLGTNYPYGPFEWGEIIGMKNIRELLTALNREHPRYAPAELIQKENYG